MTTTPAPTQQMREKFEAKYPLPKGVMFLDGRYVTLISGKLQECTTTKQRWELWQSAHQCGREEERARILSILHSEWKWFSYNAEAPHKELKSAIERIQGGK